MRINRTDITTMTGLIAKVEFADAIVVSSNEELSAEEAVNKEVYTFAGEQLQAACARLGACKAGEARITDAYALHCKYIIHAVGPVWKDGRQGEEKLLESCCKKALQIAESCGIRTIAISPIGIEHGVPAEKAAVTAVRTVVGFVKDHPDSFDKITWVIHDNTIKSAYDTAVGLMEEVLRVKAELESPELPVFQIGIRDNVVQTQMMQCLQEGHTVTPGHGIVTILDSEGRRQVYTVGAAYCQECGDYYTLLSTALSMKKQGVPLCRMLPKRDYEKEIGSADYKVNPRTLLEQYGYTIFDLKDLTDAQRHTVLASLVENKLISAAGTAGYLGDLIRLGTNNPFYKIQPENIGKWEQDRDFLALYSDEDDE